ncbi:MAG: AEC family transporter [Clostridia bacterium]|nr:AEC family transporter [Clostridia bacterium]
MQQVMDAVQIVLSIFLMIGIGMFLVGIGWLKDEHGELLSRLVVKVALPCMIISNIFTKFTRDSLIESVVGVIMPYLSIIVTLLIGQLFIRIFRIPKGRRGVFNCMLTFSNSVFIGVPVSQALFGEGVISYTLLYYIANTSLFWTIGYSMMRKDGGKEAEKTSFAMIPKYIAARFRDKGAKQAAEYAPARAALTKLSKVLPIPLVFFIGCVVLLLMGFTPPKFVGDAAKYVGNLVTPMSLFYTGMILMRMIRQKRIRWQKGYEWILVGRFAASPLLLIASSFIINLIADKTGLTALKAPELMRNALLIQAAMPVMSQTPIVAAASGSDEEYAAGGIALTTALSLVFIPLYMYVIVALL